MAYNYVVSGTSIDLSQPENTCESFNAGKSFRVSSLVERKGLRKFVCCRALEHLWPNAYKILEVLSSLRYLYCWLEQVSCLPHAGNYK